MYSDKLAIAVKSNGKILREFKDTVYIPFGSEYSLFIKNLNSVRAIVNITIDGQDACSGGLVIRGNESVDLERFIKDGNLEVGNRFKFIERTSKIEQHRGIGTEDGLIRVEFEFEVQPQPYIPPITTTWNKSPSDASKQIYPSWTSSTAGSGIFRGVGSNSKVLPKGLSDIQCSAANSNFRNTENDIGITVPGSISEQKFQTATWFGTDGIKHVMVLKLLGEVGEQPVREAVTVKTKQKCSTCGTVNNATTKFCRECGTALIIL